MPGSPLKRKLDVSVARSANELSHEGIARNPLIGHVDEELQESHEALGIWEERRFPVDRRE